MGPARQIVFHAVLELAAQKPVPERLRLLEAMAEISGEAALAVELREQAQTLRSAEERFDRLRHQFSQPLPPAPLPPG